MYISEELNEKWGDVLDHPDLSKISDRHRRNVTATLLENMERESGLAEGVAGGQNLFETAPTTSVSGAGVSTFDPVLISLVRRTAPNMMAYDICGVQPMTGPTGLIFAMRSRYTNMSGTETFYNEVNTAFSSGRSGANTVGNKMVGTVPGNTSQTSVLANASLYNYSTGVATANLEAGTTGNPNTYPEMSFSIDKVTVTAVGRALKAEYSIEIAQDLKVVHGLDAETELTNILSGEILAEINREVVRTVNVSALRGATEGTTTVGIFDLDTDSNGRWSAEKFKGLLFQVEREANQISKGTRRGKGNIILCSSDVASALQMAGVLDYTPALNSNGLNVDDTGSTFAGVLNGRYKVYIDPYTDGQYMTVGYKGPSVYDAGLFYCPYVPLQLVRAVDPNTFQPKIAFKTRYGMAPNPFAKGITAASSTAAIEEDTNVYYRRVLVTNIM